MANRLRTALFMLLLAATGCGDDNGEGILDPGAPPPDQGLEADVPPVTGGNWYRPGAGITWQWQLSGDVRTHHQADVYSGKPVLNAEYAANADEARALATRVCPAARALGLRTLILPLELDDSFRVDCF